jgi:hypothetical protein
MVVMPDKRMSACMLVLAKGLALVAVMCRVGVEVVDEDRLDVLVRLLSLVGPLTVGHQMPAPAHLDSLVSLRVPATMRARCMRLGIIIPTALTTS